MSSFVINSVPTTINTALISEIVTAPNPLQLTDIMELQQTGNVTNTNKTTLGDVKTLLTDGYVSSSTSPSSNGFFAVYDGTSGDLIKQATTIIPPPTTGPAPFSSGAYFLYSSDNVGNIYYAALPFYATTSFNTLTSVAPFGAAQVAGIFCQKVGLLVTIYLPIILSLTTSSAVITLDDPIPSGYMPPLDISRQIEVIVSGQIRPGQITITAAGMVEISLKKVVVDELIGGYPFPADGGNTSGWHEIAVQYFVNSF